MPRIIASPAHRTRGRSRWPYSPGQPLQVLWRRRSVDAFFAQFSSSPLKSPSANATAAGGAPAPHSRGRAGRSPHPPRCCACIAGRVLHRRGASGLFAPSLARRDGSTRLGACATGGFSPSRHCTCAKIMRRRNPEGVLVLSPLPESRNHLIHRAPSPGALPPQLSRCMRSPHCRPFSSRPACLLVARILPSRPQPGADSVRTKPPGGPDRKLGSPTQGAAEIVAGGPLGERRRARMVGFGRGLASRHCAQIASQRGLQGGLNASVCPV